MIIDLLLGFFADYLIEFMLFLLTLALSFRYLTYRSSKLDEAYFSSFTREIQVNIDKDKLDRVEIDNTDDYLSSILGRVYKKLPDRSLRFAQKQQKREERNIENNPMSPDGEKSVRLRDYVSGKQGLIASIHAESSVFHTKTPPNFTELTYRIMNQDKNWTKLMGHIPIDGVSRMIDILPSLFIVFGVLGTFVGISMALPEIANIDFNNLEESGSTLTRFVLQVTYAMKTSIAGIVFSLSLTFLNTLFPIKEMRNRIFKKVETCLQTLWYHIHKGQVDDNADRFYLPKILEALENLTDKLSKDSAVKKAG